MINTETYSNDHIESIKASSRNLDRFIIERTIYAFGLLEALVKVDLPFIFKGGSSLLILLETPYRLSTDIDIIVAPDLNILDYLVKAASFYPFYSNGKP